MDQVFFRGISLRQWKKIQNFSLVGEKHKKKNVNIALNHFFNMKSMFKKINEIKSKRSIYSKSKRKKFTNRTLKRSFLPLESVCYTKTKKSKKKRIKSCNRTMLRKGTKSIKGRKKNLRSSRKVKINKKSILKKKKKLPQVEMINNTEES